MHNTSPFKILKILIYVVDWRRHIQFSLSPSIFCAQLLILFHVQPLTLLVSSETSVGIIRTG